MGEMVAAVRPGYSIRVVVGAMVAVAAAASLTLEAGANGAAITARI